MTEDGADPRPSPDRVPARAGEQAPREAGFTLIELMISLALFGLIALAGLALVDGVLRVQAGTAGRLERLADVQRAMFVMTSDLEQIAPGPVAGGGAALSFNRPLAAVGGLPVPIRYGLAGGVFGRAVAVPDAGGGTQAVLDGVASLRFRFWTPDGGWVDRWPPSVERAADRPAAIAADIALMPGGKGVRGTIRRVVSLPARP